MRWTGSLPSILGFLWIAAVADAVIIPSFHAQTLMKRATHIVVATEGRSIDGVLEIVETWKGDLASRETIEIPELARFQSPDLRAVREHEGLGDVTAHVSGNRMILFLVKSIENPGDSRGKPTVKWLPASYPDHAPIFAGDREARDHFERMRISVAWSEAEGLYAYVQIMNPGPLALVNLGSVSEQSIRQAVRDLLDTRDALGRINAIPDEQERVAQAIAHAREHPERANDIVAIVAGSGTQAVEGLRTMLQSEEPSDRSRYLIQCLADVAGSDGGTDLAWIVGEELAFWRETAPTLEQGWWNGKGITREERQELRDHYSVTLEALRALDGLGYPECREVVTALRDYWRSLPHLEDPAGLTQMSETCDRVLAHLGSEPRVPVKHAWGYEVAAATADPIERAEALVPFLHIGGHRAREAAFNALAQCGAAGLPHFRAILQDEECHLHHYLAVKYFAKAGGRAAGPELTRLAADEAAFWKDNPHLPGASDWNALPGEVRARHAKLEQALLALNWLEYDGAVGVVADVRDHWKGLPRPWCLETGEIMQGCTAYLKKYAPERL